MTMQYNNEYKNTYIDINECTSRGACSISPTISALQELAIQILQNLSHYILQLEEMGANNNNIKYEIITVLASLISVNEFSDKQLYEIILKEYYMLTNSKKAYNELCSAKNIIPKDLRKIIKINNSTSISQAIALGEKIFFEKYKKLTAEQKNLMTLLLIVIKSTSLNMVKLSDFKVFEEDTYHKILTILDTFNHYKVSSKKIQEMTEELSEHNIKLQLKISELIPETFGSIEKTEVSHSTSKGKAILVSGNNLFDLYNVLKAAKDEDIGIYTHSNLLISHALKKFKEFKNLKGHFGNKTENCILDFATFPGSILITKNSKNTPEYLYRGRLFSNDYIVPDGVIKIENNNFKELIDSAKEAKGFSKGKIKDNTTIGYNEKNIIKEFDLIIKKIKNNQIKKLYIIGIDAHLEMQKEYFNELFSNIKDCEQVISFSYTSNKNNILTIPVGDYIALATKLLKILFTKYPATSEKIVFFFTTCDVMTISNIIALKKERVKNIYIAKCPPTQVNPSVLETFKNKYKVKITTNAIDDLKNIRK